MTVGGSLNLLQLLPASTFHPQRVVKRCHFPWSAGMSSSLLPFLAIGLALLLASPAHAATKLKVAFVGPFHEDSGLFDIANGGREGALLAADELGINLDYYSYNTDCSGAGGAAAAAAITASSECNDKARSVQKMVDIVVGRGVSTPIPLPPPTLSPPSTPPPPSFPRPFRAWEQRQRGRARRYMQWRNSRGGERDWASRGPADFCWIHEPPPHY